MLTNRKLGIKILENKRLITAKRSMIGIASTTLK